MSCQLEERIACPACGCESCPTVYQRPYADPGVWGYMDRQYEGRLTADEFPLVVGSDYALAECGSCGLIYQTNVPNDELMGRLYEDCIDADASHERHLGDPLEHFVGYSQEIVQLMTMLGGKPQDLAVLDYGMGWGQWALMAKAFGVRAFGSEYSPSRIENAKALGIDVIAYDEIPEHEFDLIRAEQVFEHLTNPVETLRHLRSALKPGGLVKIGVPTANDMRRRLQVSDWEAARLTGNSLLAVAPLEHINCFNRTSLRAMAARAGMAEVAVPLSVQYRWASDWRGPAQVARNLVRPIYWNARQPWNNVVFRRVD